MTAFWVGALLASAILLWPSRRDTASQPARLRPPVEAWWARAGGPSPDEHTPGLRWGAGLVRGLRRRGSRAEDGEALAEFAELLALCLRSGLPPGEAVQIARRDTASPDSQVMQVADLLADLEGGPLSAGPGGSEPCQVAERPGRGAGARADPEVDSSLLSAAWSLGVDCGAPLTEAVEASASALRAGAAARRRAATARAGPRASMWLLTVLPLAGPLAALAIGTDPMATFGQPVALGSVAAGVALTALGWWWSRRLLARAEAPTVFR